jgi:hypothetical protein
VAASKLYLPARSRGGKVEWTPVAGTRTTETIQTLVSQADRIRGFAFDLNDAGAIRSIVQVSVKHKQPQEQPNRKIVTAREGYTLYGMNVDFAADKVNAIRLVFVRLDGDRMVPQDTYTSDWIGKPSGAKPVTLACNGKKVVGFSRSLRDDLLTGVSLSLKEETPAATPTTQNLDGSE